MTTAASSAERLTDPAASPSRGIRLLRVTVLMLAGLTIAFTATSHENLGFDLTVAAVSLGAIGVTQLIEWVATRGSARSAVTLLLGVIGVVAAILLPVTHSLIGFAVVIAAWAVVSALLEFTRAVITPGDRQDGVLLGALGMILALLVLLVREDQVAILGFFGGYTVIAGVFLGISAFDATRKAPRVAEVGASDQNFPQQPLQ